MLTIANRPYPENQYSNMAPRLKFQDKMINLLIFRCCPSVPNCKGPGCKENTTKHRKALDPCLNIDLSKVASVFKVTRFFSECVENR